MDSFSCVRVHKQYNYCVIFLQTQSTFLHLFFSFYARIFYLMLKPKEQILTSSTHSRKPLKQSKPSTPYDQIPVSLRVHQMRPFSQLLHNQQYSLARKQKVREITSHTIQRDFRTTHHLAQHKEKQLLKKFKVRCKRKEQASAAEANQQFFSELLKPRQAEQYKLNGQYLAVVRQEMRGRAQSSDQDFQNREKRICEYNMMYDYRAEHLPNPFKRK